MMAELLAYCINGFRGDDGKLRTPGKPLTEADVKKLIEDMKAVDRRWPFETPEQILEYAINGATWLEMPGRKSKDTVMEDQDPIGTGLQTRPTGD